MLRMVYIVKYALLMLLWILLRCSDHPQAALYFARRGDEEHSRDGLKASLPRDFVDDTQKQRHVVRLAELGCPVGPHAFS